MNRYTATIDGEPVDTAAHLDVLNPAIEELVAPTPDCGLGELDAAGAAARAAFPKWRIAPIAERQRLVKALGEMVKAKEDELMRLLTSEQGKPHADATGDVLGDAMWCNVYGDMPVPAEIAEDLDDRPVEVRRTPMGVVGALARWNFPVIPAMLKAAPALVAGNTVMLKPSPGGQVRSGDTERALATGSLLETGNVFINQSQVILPQAPFGGHESSGIGSDSALEGLLAYTNAQTVMVSKESVAA